MLRLVVIVLILGGVLSFKYIDPDMQTASDACAKENNLELSEVDSDDNFNKKVGDNHDYKCYLKCVAIKFEHYLENGEPNYEKFKSDGVDNSEGIKAVKKCAEDNQQEDLCDKVYEIQNCITKDLVDL